MGNGRGMPKPAASCTTTVMPGMVDQDAADLGGGRQGPAGRHGTPADQPPARLPDLRQGRRVPAAEPGHEQRPRRIPLRRGQAHLPQAGRGQQPTCCSTANAACCASAAPASPSRSPATRSSTCSSAARTSRSARPTERALPVLLLRQHGADLPGRRPDRCVLPVPGPSVRPAQLGRRRVRALLVRLRPAHRLAPLARSPAGWPVSNDPEVNEEWNCDKGRWAFHYAEQPDRIHSPRWFVTPPASSSRPAGPRRSKRAATGLPRRSTAVASACCPAVG